MSNAWQFLMSHQIARPEYGVFEQRYALKYFSYLLTKEEQRELSACAVSYITGELPFCAPSKRSFSECKTFAYEKTEWLLDQYRELIYQDTCPNCKRLRMTPKARQCLWCAHFEQKL